LIGSVCCVLKAVSILLCLFVLFSVERSYVGVRYINERKNSFASNNWFEECKEQHFDPTSKKEEFGNQATLQHTIRTRTPTALLWTRAVTFNQQPQLPLLYQKKENKENDNRLTGLG